jgi:glycosyltransferase involved in cell wall biosynthesis
VKIAHLNTLTYGGAAVVACRMHQSLQELGIDSVLFTKYGQKGFIRNHHFLRDAGMRIFLRRNLTNPHLFRLAKSIQNLKRPGRSSQSQPEFEIFSFLKPLPVTREFRLLNDRDIIHLHWINNFIGYESFFRQFKDKRFVWTLHDMNPFTGGCHHSDGCMKFEEDCRLCPQLLHVTDPDTSHRILNQKMEGLQYLKDDQLVIVSPSQWLLDLSKKSQINRRFRHELIPNPSFKRIFSESRDSIRSRLHLPKDKKIVLFASDNLNNPRKGIGLLFEAVRMLKEKTNIVLLGVGHKSHRPVDLDVRYTGSLTDSNLLADYFYSADLFVTPSIAENSPLVVIESLTCGTPVLGSDVGGIPDLINEKNGAVFPVRNIERMSKCLYEALFERIFDRQAIMDAAIEKHHPLRIAEKYITIYRSLIPQT